MQQFDSMVTGARLRMSTSSPSQTWSPAEKRHGKVMFTWDRITTPFPTVAPKSRRSATRSPEGHGSGVWKKRARTAHQAASLSGEAPRWKPPVV